MLPFLTIMIGVAFGWTAHAYKIHLALERSRTAWVARAERDRAHQRERAIRAGNAAITRQRIPVIGASPDDQDTAA